VEFQHVTVTRI